MPFCHTLPPLRHRRQLLNACAAGLCLAAAISAQAQEVAATELPRDTPLPPSVMAALPAMKSLRVVIFSLLG